MRKFAAWIPQPLAFEWLSHPEPCSSVRLTTIHQENPEQQSLLAESNGWASSASVWSTLRAATITMAWKAGEWLRRGRLLMLRSYHAGPIVPQGAETPLIRPFRFPGPAHPWMLRTQSVALKMVVDRCLLTMVNEAS